ncbi:hypothetical protein ACOXXX_10885 [Thalassococcus sp. BH17M4-6]|uniref:hypothetical protein n=1 Tax=Thalassococcus sp. BH17M4-6 TaxID=3413148 RepID=UPI003BD99923
MGKGSFFALLLVSAAVAAGLFGALHNQLSYSVGASYFHDFKFAQFGVPGDLHNRLGAALVGWRASWWVGLLVGLPAFLLGLFLMARPQAYLAAGLGAIFAVVMLTLLASGTGLFIGMTLADAAMLQDIPIPDGVTDRAGFVRAGLMHDASYIGGALGLILALVIVWRAARAERALLNARKTP